MVSVKGMLGFVFKKSSLFPKKNKKKERREFPAGPVVKTPSSHCQGPRINPCWETKIPQAVRCSFFKKKKRKKHDWGPSSASIKWAALSRGCPRDAHPPVAVLAPGPQGGGLSHWPASPGTGRRIWGALHVRPRSFWKSESLVVTPSPWSAMHFSLLGEESRKTRTLLPVSSQTQMLSV